MSMAIACAVVLVAVLDGGVVNNRDAYFGAGGPEGTGTLTVRGAGSAWNGRWLLIGGGGTLTVSDGGAVSVDSCDIWGGTRSSAAAPPCRPRQGLRSLEKETPRLRSRTAALSKDQVPSLFRGASSPSAARNRGSSTRVS
ncbi:MAG: hypothetical protein JW809_02635 [Pirellulales bacterium]|nr:hypothetical protein [Pirellulales bacterium]